MMKRIIDISASLLGGLTMLPLIFLLMILIKLDGHGPSLFKQLRVGKNGELFKCIKLRTMKSGTPNKPTHEVNHDQITFIGRFLRKSKLDELPQLYNVFVGDMSLVGPRPCLPDQHTLVEKRRKCGVFNIRPGITGLSQIHGIEMSRPYLLTKIDSLYANENCILGDICIMINTILPINILNLIRYISYLKIYFKLK